jgi:pimeloyl-ACP methyl ester carboxylesterase
VDLQQLVAIGPPPYATSASSAAEQQVLGRHLAKSENSAVWGRDFLFAPGYSLSETFELIAGATQHRSILVRDDERYNASARGTHFDVPLFFFEGADDIEAPVQLVREYIEQITAPRKELVTFLGGGHNAFYFFSSQFLHELLVRVRPLAIAGDENPK